jgi:long-chain acyl-CoA synthetase
MPDRTIFSVLEDAASRYGVLPALHQPLGGKKYRTYSWNEYRDIAREIACGLRSLGIGKGEIISLHSETRAEFYLADLGILANGSIAAALYTSLPAAEHARTFRIASPRALLAESGRDVKALRQAGVGAPGMLWVVLSGDAPEDCLTLDQLREKGRAAMAADAELFSRVQAEVSPDDHAVLYLTSGATGEPKMGLVTHRAVVSNIEMGPKVVKLGPEDSVLAFLPSAHIAQRVGIEFLPLVYGAPVHFSEGLAKMPNELREIRPTFFLAPPRVWERVYASISAEIRKRPAPVRNLFYTALGLGLKASDLRQQGKPVARWMQQALSVADKVMFRKIRERLGGRLRIPVSGAAPLGKDLARFYSAIGMPLIEGYGLTEAGIVSLNPVDAPRPGSIGKPLPGVEMKLAEDGELLIRSGTAFSGYYKDPESTAAVLRGEWLHTGDIAESDHDGYYYITGRKKELIVSSNGKKIYPARIESLFKVEPLINQVLLIGDRQPYVTALMTLNATVAEGKDREVVSREVEQAVRRVNKQLAQFEQIRRFKVLEQDFSIERGELTPTMKVRRKQVLDNYKQAVSELYLGKEEIV